MKIKDGELIDIKPQDEAKVICNLAKSQVIASKHACLFFHIFKRAVSDAFGVDSASFEERGQALLYLRDDMIHAEMIGIDSTWIRHKINKTKTLNNVFNITRNKYKGDGKNVYYSGATTND